MNQSQRSYNPSVNQGRVLHHAYYRDGRFVGSYPDDPENAAIAGFAQSISDYNPRSYRRKYLRLVVREQHKIWCGNVFVPIQ